MEAGLLIIRVVLGGTMAAHGAQKLFGMVRWPRPRRGRGLARVDGPEARSRVCRGQRAREFGGGALLALGLLTPLGAATWLPA
jgi:putative oxidoreductase